MAATVFTVSALAVELDTDPASLGYAPAILAGDQNTLFTLVNTPQPGGGFQVNRDPVPPEEVFGAVDPVDYVAMTTTELARLQVIMTLPTVNLADESTKTIVDELFTNGSTTRLNIATLQKRNGSRAEVLWGEGTIVTVNQIDQALQI